MGRMKRTLKFTQTDAPGPGSYTPSRVIRKAPDVLMGTSRRDIKRFLTPSPGPAQYSSDGPKRNDIGFSFAHRAAPAIPKGQSPSPAEYSVEKPAIVTSPRAIIGRARRNERTDMGNIPGPG